MSKGFPMSPSMGPWLLEWALNYAPLFKKVVCNVVLMALRRFRSRGHTRGPWDLL